MITDDLIQIPVNAFAYELIREELLPDLMGKEASRILYWAGKNLARKYPVETVEDILAFFEKAGWGTLTIVEQKRREMQLELTGPLVTERYRNKRETTYQMEAGFIAQQLQQQRKVITEAYEEQKKRSNKVLFIVQWDAKDTIEE
ncbi:YslB family protein [Ectobacillus antri]|jgi:predicted hydrocarbon binding protein|uniref:YslB family protein n=1 Tax=Ectobacillus antri TaxID=2486280 RepID=A0ABT6H4C1_9BACI|nr:YslB family protein [Ectobacillus antri]MDG4656583.1 YslB family protein [Ectobacillus antri]MDG5753633.1 YslB family protein [Ectobacillus antri]